MDYKSVQFAIAIYDPEKFTKYLDIVEPKYLEKGQISLMVRCLPESNLKRRVSRMLEEEFLKDEATKSPKENSFSKNAAENTYKDTVISKPAGFKSKTKPVSSGVVQKAHSSRKKKRKKGTAILPKGNYDAAQRRRDKEDAFVPKEDLVTAQKDYGPGATFSQSKAKSAALLGFYHGKKVMFSVK